MKVLVSGTTGELGKQVFNWFSKYYNDYQLLAMDDLSDASVLKDLFLTQNIDAVIHLSSSVGQTSMGTRNLLQAAKDSWSSNHDAHRFLLITADPFEGEVLLREYHIANGMNLLVSSCEDTFESPDFPFVYASIAEQNISGKNTIPVYTKGQEVPEWFWVEEHACALDVLFHQAEAGKSYSIGGMNGWKRGNIEYNPIVQHVHGTYNTVNAR